MTQVIDNTIIITEHHQCRRYDDLCDADKQRVRNRYYDYTTDYNWWEDYTYPKFVEDMASKGILVDSNKIYFRLVYSQGDGAAFEADVDVPKFLAHMASAAGHRDAAIALAAAIEAERVEVSCSVRDIGRLSCVQRAEMVLDWYQDDMSDTDQKFFQNVVDEASAYLEELCREAANKLYVDLRHDYESRITDEAFADSFNANNCVFEIGTGRMFYYEEQLYEK